MLNKIQDEVKKQIQDEKRERQSRQIKERLYKIEKLQEQIKSLQEDINKIEEEPFQEVYPQWSITYHTLFRFPPFDDPRSVIC
jgi:TolA-binding protein